MKLVHIGEYLLVESTLVTTKVDTRKLEEYTEGLEFNTSVTINLTLFTDQPVAFLIQVIMY